MTRSALLPNVRESSRLNGQLKLCSGFFEAELAVLNKLLLLTYQEPFGLRDTFGRRRPAPARERPWAACDNRTMQQEYRGKTYNHRASRGIGVAGDLAQARLNRTERRGKKADGVGEHDGKSGARQQEPRGYAEKRAHRRVHAIVEPGERDEEAYGKHRAGNCIANRRDDAQSMDQL